MKGSRLYKEFRHLTPVGLKLCPLKYYRLVLRQIKLNTLKIIKSSVVHTLQTTSDSSVVKHSDFMTTYFL